MTVWRKRTVLQCVARDSITFLLDKQHGFFLRIEPSQTPDELGLEDNDEIDAVPEELLEDWGRNAAAEPEKKKMSPQERLTACGMELLAKSEFKAFLAMAATPAVHDSGIAAAYSC